MTRPIMCFVCADVDCRSELVANMVWRFCLANRLIVVRVVMSGFVAQNVTVSVTISLSNTTLTLRSVYGWLTILSRINSSFPTDLSYTTYQNGFGDIKSNYWLGLERTYQITNIYINGGRSYRLRFEFLSGDDHR